MQKHRRILETLEERDRRLVREAQMKRDAAAASEAALIA